MRSEVSCPLVGTKALGMNQAGPEQETANEGVRPLDENFAHARNTKQAERKRQFHICGRPVGDCVQNGERVYSLRVPGCPGETDGPTPVLGHDGGFSQIQGLEELLDSRCMARDSVERGVVGLVGATEAEVIGNNHTKTSAYERRDEVTPEVTPGRVAVNEDHRSSVARTLIDVVEPPFRGLEPVRLVRPCTTKGPVGSGSHR